MGCVEAYVTFGIALEDTLCITGPSILVELWALSTT